MAKQLAGENVALARGYAKFLTHGMIHMDAEDIYEMIEAHSETYALEQLKNDIVAGPTNPISDERLAKQGPVEQCFNILRMVKELDHELDANTRGFLA